MYDISFYPHFTVILQHNDFGQLCVSVPIDRCRNMSNLRGTYGYFSDLPGVDDVTFHLTGDRNQLPYTPSVEKFCYFCFTISGCGRCVLYLPSDVPGEKFSSIRKWIENFEDVTLAGVTMVCRGYVD